MRVIEPYQLYGNRQKRHKKKTFRSIFLISVILGAIIASYAIYTLYRPYPTVQAEILVASPASAADVALAWPAYGQSAAGAIGYGVLDDSGNNKPAPTASIAKVMTALAVLRKHPLALNEQGPTITITAQDIEFYREYLNKNGSVVNVVIGGQISQYQAMQAMLIASANNMADTLAVWAFGSLKDYTAYANQLAKELKMDNSTFADDASGFSPNTTSTATDLVKLGLAAMQEPVIAQIVAQPEAAIPNSANVRTTNQLLGKNDIVGIKTGNTDQAGDCYLFAANHTLGSGQRVTVIGVIMGGPSFKAVYTDAPNLLNSVYGGFISKTIIRSGEAVAEYQAPWTSTVPVTAANDVNTLYWQASPPQPKFNLETLTPPAATNQQVGTVSAANGAARSTSALTLKDSLPKPSFWWQLTHPFNN